MRGDEPEIDLYVTGHGCITLHMRGDEPGRASERTATDRNYPHMRGDEPERIIAYNRERAITPTSVGTKIKSRG